MHYIHIGMHKAGSTTVQKFLSNNVDVLRRYGREYPALDDRATSHNRLVYALHSRSEKDTDLCSEMINTISQTDRSIIISSEGFEYIKRRQIRKFRNMFGDSPCKIIFYIRSFEELVPSKYTQRTKTGINISTIDCFVDTALSKTWLKIADTIERWATSFMPATFAICQLERLEKRSDALVRQLWRDLDLPDGDFNGQAINADARSNPSPHWIAVEFVRAINQELNRHSIEWNDLADTKRIKTKRIIEGDEEAVARHINGLLPVLQDAVAKCGLEGKTVRHLQESDRLRIRDFYNAEITRINAMIGTDLRPAEAVPAPDREAIPSVELLTAAERQAVWRAIAHSRRIASLPEVVQACIKTAVKG